MDIRDLQVFLAVSARLNFTRAAEDVHLSQPSVSVRIRHLEAELGVKLFMLVLMMCVVNVAMLVRGKLVKVYGFVRGAYRSYCSGLTLSVT